MKRLSRPLQVITFVSCLLMLMTGVNGLYYAFRDSHWWTDWDVVAIYYVFIFMPILALKLIFAGDESPIGRRLYAVGDRVYRGCIWLLAYVPGAQKLFAGTKPRPIEDEWKKAEDQETKAETN